MARHPASKVGFFVLLCCCGSSIAEPVTCGRGERLVAGTGLTNDICVPCSAGTYQDADRHRSNTCYVCNTFNEHSPYFKLVDECTRFHDTIVRCSQPGFYYTYDDDGGICKLCTNCSAEGKHQGAACTETADTVCCQDDGMLVTNGTCGPRPVCCSPGEVCVPMGHGDVSSGEDSVHRGHGDVSSGEDSVLLEIIIVVSTVVAYGAGFFFWVLFYNRFINCLDTLLERILRWIREQYNPVPQRENHALEATD